MDGVCGRSASCSSAFLGKTHSLHRSTTTTTTSTWVPCRLGGKRPTFTTGYSSQALRVLAMQCLMGARFRRIACRRVDGMRGASAIGCLRETLCSVCESWLACVGRRGSAPDRLPCLAGFVPAVVVDGLWWWMD